MTERFPLPDSDKAGEDAANLLLALGWGKAATDLVECMELFERMKPLTPEPYRQSVVSIYNALSKVQGEIEVLVNSLPIPAGGDFPVADKEAWALTDWGSEDTPDEKVIVALNYQHEPPVPSVVFDRRCNKCGAPVWISKATLATASAMTEAAVWCGDCFATYSTRSHEELVINALGGVDKDRLQQAGIGLDEDGQLTEQSHKRVVDAIRIKRLMSAIGLDLKSLPIALSQAVKS